MNTTKQQIVMINGKYVSIEDRTKQVLLEVEHEYNSYKAFTQSIKDDIIKYKKLLDTMKVK